MEEELTNSIRKLTELQIQEVQKISKEKQENEKMKQDLANKVKNLIDAVRDIQNVVLPYRYPVRLIHLSNQNQYSPTDDRLPCGTRSIRNVSEGCFDGVDAVLVTDWYSAGNLVLAQELTKFVLRGGTVVFCCWGNSTNQAPNGSFEQYHALIPTPDSASEATLGTIKIPDHPLVHGVKTITQGTDKRRMPGAVAPGAQLVAEWTDGVPMAAVRVIPGGGVVVSFSFQVGNVGAQGDAMKMVWNGLMLTTENSQVKLL